MGFAHNPITLYTDKSELFVEFKPLTVGETSKFAAHFTQLGENFKAVTDGSVTVGLIGGGTPLTDKAEAPSSPGIFRLALTPENPGTYQLVFDIQTKEFSDKITVANITQIGERVNNYVKPLPGFQKHQI